MSLSTQTQKRLPTIKEGLLTGLSYTQIGEKLGVTKRTIDRDVHTWLESGDFETWLKQEWIRLHNIILHENPTEAYRQISKIMSRMVTRKIEAKSVEQIELKEERRQELTINFNELSEDAKRKVLAAEEILSRTES